jgi:hypothetical protein
LPLIALTISPLHTTISVLLPFLFPLYNIPTTCSAPFPLPSSASRFPRGPLCVVLAYFPSAVGIFFSIPPNLHVLPRSNDLLPISVPHFPHSSFSLSSLSLVSFLSSLSFIETHHHSSHVLRAPYLSHLMTLVNSQDLALAIAIAVVQSLQVLP